LERVRSARFWKKYGAVAASIRQYPTLVSRPACFAFISNKIKHTWRSHSAIVRDLLIVRQCV
jgi:hypothetical protein